MSIGDSSSAVADFSSPHIGSIGGVTIKRLPAGEALGAHDMERWSSNRSGGRSGAYTTKNERQILNTWKTPQQLPRAKRTRHEDAVKRGILVEQTSRGWFVSLPDGSRKGPFKRAKDAWSWIDRRLDKRNPSAQNAGASLHHQEGTPGRQAD